MWLLPTYPLPHSKYSAPIHQRTIYVTSQNKECIKTPRCKYLHLLHGCQLSLQLHKKRRKQSTEFILTY